MGSGNNRAQQQAEANERARQAQIAAGTKEVNRIFSDPAREAQIGDVLSATRELYMDALNRQKGDADRQAKFATARAGTAGGSQQRDLGMRLGEDYVKGLTEAERLTQSQGADLRMQDQASKQNLLAMIQSGLDVTTASQQAASALRNNLGVARSSARVNDLGNVFGQFADIARRSQENAARRQGELYSYNTIYQSGPWALRKPGSR